MELFQDGAEMIILKTILQKTFKNSSFNGSIGLWDVSSVTDASGNFSIENIPPGTYEVVCWQEKFGSKRAITSKVTIGDGDTNKDFVFSRPKKK